MIGLPEINEKFASMKLDAATITGKKNVVKSKVSEIEREGRSEEWTEEEKRATHAKGAAEINAHILKITEVSAPLLQQEKFWADKELVLSKIPLTKRSSDNWTAENPVSESFARAALLAEASRMSNERLSIMAEEAISSGNPAAAYLFSLEGNSRAKSANIKLSGIVIPEQVEALKIFHEAKKIVAHALVDLREASGEGADKLSIGRLNAERGLL